MRILTVVIDLGPYGTQRVAQNYTLAYQRLGHETAVLAHRGGGSRRRVLEAAAVPVFLGDQDIEAAVTATDRFDPQLIHIHRAGMRNDFETELLSRLRRDHRRVIETNVFARPDYSAGADFIDVHCQISRWCMWRWRKWLCSRRSADTPGAVIPNAVESESFNRASPTAVEAFRRENRIPPEAFVCGRIGSPNDANWDISTLAAFAHLASRDRSAHLVLVNPPVGILSKVDALPTDTRARVRALPAIEEDVRLATAYSSFDCFLHSAKAGESFGMVLCEAMLCGVPVVTASVPHKSNSQVEVVGHLVGGLVAGSRAQLPAALVRLRDDSTLRQHCAAAGRASVIQRYGSDHVARLALKVGEIALQCRDRKSLCQALRDDPELQTHTSDETADELLRNTFGGPRRAELLARSILHRPLVHRAIYRLNYWRIYRKNNRSWPNPVAPDPPAP